MRMKNTAYENAYAVFQLLKNFILIIEMLMQYYAVTRQYLRTEGSNVEMAVNGIM